MGDGLRELAEGLADAGEVFREVAGRPGEGVSGAEDFVRDADALSAGEVAADGARQKEGRHAAGKAPSRGDVPGGMKTSVRLKVSSVAAKTRSRLKPPSPKRRSKKRKGSPAGKRCSGRKTPSGRKGASVRRDSRASKASAPMKTTSDGPGQSGLNSL
ncbi:MAG: hypothetical protein LBQ79_03890 [Deltaproteobacteria bacterium]|nr:hypothetical protein [Deltaproteobacteria bacterium]